MILAGRGFGKAACIETPVPTPDGWKRLGDIAVGDEVFDESGRPSRVEATYDSVPEVGYRLWFSDGTHVDVCSEHLWTTWRHRDRKALGRSAERDVRLPAEWPTWRSPGGAGPQVRSTQEIVESLTHGKRGDLNHSVPVCAPLVLPERDLPLDPYVLGAWLGDGSKYGSQIAAAVEDHPHWYEHLAAFAPHSVTDPITIATYGLHVVLRGMGLLKNKHVPAEYLRASESQRLALLQGLMDTDGSAAPSSVEFTNTNHNLVLSVVELARSLGQKPVVAEGRAMLDGRDCGAKWRVTWRPTIPVFRMERKAKIVKALASQGIRNQHRMIVYAEQIDPKPMRCLTVASRHHTFLLGEAMIPTHNTLTGAQWSKKKLLEIRNCRLAFVAPTFRDARRTMMEGESGLISVLPAEAMIGQSIDGSWNKSSGELTLANGSKVELFSSETPNRLRGPAHHGAWCDELSSFGDCQRGDSLESTWSNLKLGCRLGANPQILITTTPKANKLTKELLKLPAPRMMVVRGSSFENRENLSEAWWQEVVAPYVGTRIGRQEVYAEVLDDVEGALWTQSQLDDVRVLTAPPLQRIVVAVDPNISSEEAANDAGIIVAGVGHSDKHGYILADKTVTRGGPRAWASAVVKAYEEYEADRIVAEKNQGGEMVGLTIRTVDPHAPIKLVSATKGKRVRAEPVAALYEGSAEVGPRVHHVGAFPELEDEMTQWTPDAESPNRMDALVWALTELMLGRRNNEMSVHMPKGRIPTERDKLALRTFDGTF